MKSKIIFFLIDGLADKNSLKTPLKISNKPFIEFLLKNKKGFLSYILPLEKKYWPKYGEASVSGLANLGILGYKIKPDLFKRGPYEAIGIGVKYKNGWLAFRANFASVDRNLRVIDRRVGRNIYGLDILEKEINKIKFSIPFVFKRGLGHRGVLIFKQKLSDKISFNDPLDINKKVKKIKNLSNDSLSIKTAKILNEFLRNVYIALENHKINIERTKKGLPPANYLLLREGGTKILKLRNFFEKYGFKNGITLATLGVDLGTCLSIGFKKFVLQESKDAKEEFKNVYKGIKKVINKYEIIYIHLKKADEASHDKNFEKKKIFFELFDQFFKKIYNKNIIFVITGDHITSIKTGKHAYGPVPLLILNSSLNNNPSEFSEREAIRLGRFFTDNSKIWEFLNNDRK